MTTTSPMSYLLILLLAAGCGVSGVAKSFKPDQPLARWSNDDWATVLAAVATPDGYVKYGVLTSNQGGTRDALYRYVGQLATASPENRPDLFSGEDDKLAYWLNAYNAACMYGVLDKGLPGNVLLSGVFFFPNEFEFGGHMMTLDGLEGSKVRSVGDPRIHFALNCMSRSCPPLRGEPYEGAKLDAQLTDQSHRYLSDPRGAVRDGDNVKLGGIFGFYAGDFVDWYRKKTGNEKADLLDAVKTLAGPDSPVNGAKGYSKMGYDWDLNRAK